MEYYVIFIALFLLVIIPAVRWRRRIAAIGHILNRKNQSKDNIARRNWHKNSLVRNAWFIPLQATATLSTAR